MSVYTRLPNYANNLIRLGFTQDEITNQSDRLVDAIVCWGTLDKIAARIKERRRRPCVRTGAAARSGRPAAAAVARTCHHHPVAVTLVR